MNAAREWLNKHHEDIVRGLADLVAIQSISTDGEHQHEIDRSASLVCQQMRDAGLQNVEKLTVPGSLPYAYGEWCDAPGKPTVFLYAHHDVQPINYVEQWKSEPWRLTRRDGRLYARGSADDKGAISAQLAAVAAYLKTVGSLPINIKMVVEGEEEIGSKNLPRFFAEYQKKIASDVIVVCDTENIEVGIPSLTYSLRGVTTLQVDVETATLPVHSGMGGGAIADAALALNVVLSRLYWNHGEIPVPGFYDSVRVPTEAERATFRKLPLNDAAWRHDLGVLPGVEFANETGVHLYEQTWRRPAVTIIAQEASNLRGASNQVLPKASALISCRMVPDQDPEAVIAQLSKYLTENPPWGAKVTVKPASNSVKWWMTDPNGPAFEAALAALRVGYDRDPVPIGCGGTIGFVGPLAELFGGAPALLVGIEDPASNAHAPNESLHEGDFRKLMQSLVLLFENLGKLTPNQVK
ncbi:M20/M25/M40 family metallo-hydrolase [Tuwongella immobilis]|uniref:Peptidase M20 dimerisation domain-containing protein n=1 Tax=Tuwongella immobilis TaxID=692036 RepID=A0A6C2YTS0_9BACT|nr:M20/M25/M40 family metallo-hydrolase [Tuwongella immobilis]VIP04282.1 peptidase m20 : Peptidase M20 OS=uncultured planctomycete GN=HGMM_F07G10C22 PE=4 SV=1: Peptidase_M20: M20_dimer [Tuwongella immobilis]VTS05927.1 peptidase m20 : Peptidase M20 OS=uncultured planctomycete GN=HGMM_F07G10C22 PE=4 SV=1: Peptidase_M20: M20_dimer [Tuwongella immobilis]